MKRIRCPLGLMITGMALLLLWTACDSAGSLAGNRDTIWQKVKESSSYTVDFNPNGGNPVPQSQTVHYGSKAVNPDNILEKDSNIFLGWFTEESCTNEWDFSADTVTGNTTLYAKWKESVGYAVAFNVYTAKAPVYGQDVADGGLIIQPDSPERDNSSSGDRYIFDQWYREQSYTTPWDFANDKVTADITLYGTWKKLDTGQNAVRFKANGGSPVPEDQAVSTGAKVSDPQMELTKAHYTFGGWYNDTACTIPWLFDIDTVSGDTPIYAQWNEEGYYTVNFYTDGGTPTPNQQFLAQNSFVIKPEEDPAKTGYTFDGWYWYNSFEGNDFIPWTFDSNKLPGNLILYANWTPISYTVRFYANDGTQTSTDEDFKYDEQKPLTANSFTRTGYTFTGWNTQADGKGTSYVNNASVQKLSAIDGDTFSLYAQWKINQYTVTFDTAGGSAVPQRTVDYGTKLTKPADPI